MADNPKPRPFRDGRLAFVAGQPIESNPYVGQIGDKGVDMGQSWIYGWRASEMDALLAETPIPDLNLIAECENLIPKGSFWCGHELNRSLHYYNEACAAKDSYLIKSNERSLRQILVKARLEAAGLKP